MKKMTCALLLCLLSASAMFSCQSGASGTQAGTEADTGTSNPVPVETEEAYAYPEVSLGGDTFRILYMTQPYYFYDSSDFDGLSGETVDDAVYQRNRSVEDRFDMTLEFDKRFELEDAVTNLSNLIMAGDTTHDAALLVHRYLSSLITQNYLYDLNTLADHFTFDEPWWNKELNDEIQIGKQNARPAAFTDTALTTFEGTMVTYINEAIRENLDLDEPYDLVRNGKWTMDAMRSYMKAAANLNGAADFTYAADTPALYGMTSFNSGHIAFLFSGDTVLFEQDKNGEITYMPQADRLITKAQKIIEDLSVPGEYFYYNNSQDENFETVFQRNQALLMVGELKAASLLRSMNADFGILPIPKFDEAQEAYRNSISFGYVACIPTTAEDPGVSADILDVLAYETYRDVMPLFVNERISQKALRSDVSVEMLSLIQQSRCFDIGYIFGWSTDFYNVFNDACQKGDTDIVSALEKTKEKTASLITKTMDAVNTEA